MKHIEHLKTDHISYDSEVSQILSTLNYTPKVIFDIGANVGGFSIALSKKFSTSYIYAFEPVYETYSLLEKNIKHYNNILPYNVGLYSSNKENVPIGMPQIPVHKTHNYGRATICDFIDDPIDHINLVKFSDLCLSNNVYPDLIKIDAEGCEYEILKDAYDSKILSKVKTIYIEINNHYNTKLSAQKSKQLLLQDFDIVGTSVFNASNNEPLNYIFQNKNEL